MASTARAIICFKCKRRYEDLGDDDGPWRCKRCEAPVKRPEDAQ